MTWHLVENDIQVRDLLIEILIWLKIWMHLLWKFLWKMSITEFQDFNLFDSLTKNQTNLMLKLKV